MEVQLKLPAGLRICQSYCCTRSAEHQAICPNYFL